MRRPVIALLAACLVVASVACSGDDTGDAAAFCARLREARSLDEIFAAAFQSSDPAEIEGAVERARRELADLTELAPSDVDREMELVERAFDELSTLLGEADPGDRQAAVAALARYQGDIGRIETATRKVTAYGTDVCGIEEDGDPGTTTSTG